MRRRVETDEGSRMERGVDSILRLFRVFFFTLARTVSSNFLFFFFQLFNDERASRRRCCLSSAAHKSCAKLARRTPSAFYFLSPPSMYDSTRHDTWGNLERRPWWISTLPSISVSTARPTLRFFSARGKDESRGATIKSKSLDFTSSSFFSLGKENSSLEDWKRKGRRRERERERDFERYLSWRGKIYARVAFRSVRWWRMLAAYMWESNGFNPRDAKLFGFDQQGEKNHTSLTESLPTNLCSLLYFTIVFPFNVFTKLSICNFSNISQSHNHDVTIRGEY